MIEWDSLEPALDALGSARPGKKKEVKDAKALVVSKVGRIVNQAMDAVRDAHAEEKRVREKKYAMQRETVKIAHEAMRGIIENLAEANSDEGRIALASRLQPICSKWADEYDALLVKWKNEVKTLIPDEQPGPAGEA